MHKNYRIAEPMDAHPDTLTQLARPHRKAVLVALLWITISGGILFGFLNAMKGTWALAGVEWGMGLYSAVLLYYVHRTRHLERWILAYIFPFFTAMMIALATPTASVTIFGWVLLIPLVSHLLLGRRAGLAISLLFIVVAAIIFLWRFMDDTAVMDARSVANMIVLTACITVFSHVYEVSRERSETQLLHMAQTDFLTGLPNRSRIKMFFEREKSRAVREGQPLSLLVIDLDHFKQVNDHHGHEAGDRALIFFADLLRRRLRTTDLAGRLGGEEFGVILVNTATVTASQVAEELRQALATANIEHSGEAIPLSLSVGVAELGVDGETLQDLLAVGDSRLYQAKEQGRNRVVPPPVTSRAAASSQSDR
ncbi:GGDEF domain-containing protein [Marinobacter segnicrescens]|uniref:GGDEF domain-containing protein n=1 Tax=Marinobacter segnicrescens TaxID=430453 RepID=UPI003A910EE7